jgi:hypothetical protein
MTLNKISSQPAGNSIFLVLWLCGHVDATCVVMFMSMLAISFSTSVFYYCVSLHFPCTNNDIAPVCLMKANRIALGPACTLGSHMLFWTSVIFRMISYCCCELPFAFAEFAWILDTGAYVLNWWTFWHSVQCLLAECIDHYGFTVLGGSSFYLRC